jgi:adenine deaminase
MGQIAPGRYADILLVTNLPDMRVASVYAKGQQIAQDGKWLVNLPTYAYPDWAANSVHLGKPLTPSDFDLPSPSRRDGAGVRVNVIGVIENQAPTRHLKLEVTPENGEVKVDISRDLAKIALVERHKGTGGVTVGLVNGFGFTERCAIATTVAHDSHHMIVVGTDESDMALATNKLGEVNGGQVVVKDGEVIGLVELPIAGLMSNERAGTVAEKAATILRGFEACGCTLNNPNMQLSLLALAVIPELRISDLGLVDVNKFELIPIFE